MDKMEVISMLKSRLKVLLAERDMTQTQLSERTGIRPGTVTNIARGTIRQIPVDAVCKICEVLQCNIGDIFVYVPDDR